MPQTASDQCRRAALARWAKPGARARASEAARRAAQARWDKTGRGQRLLSHTCLHCGQDFEAYASEHRKYCSRVCSAAVGHSHAALEKIRAAAARRSFDRVCSCGAEFTTTTGNRKLCGSCISERERARMRRRHSSAEEVARSASKKRRRVEIERLGEPFDKIDIYERDGYVCQLCGEPTDPTAHYNDNAYPSIDHIVPLARGGIHGPENVQTAHRGCNSAKGARLTPAAA